GNLIPHPEGALPREDVFLGRRGEDRKRKKSNQRSHLMSSFMRLAQFFSESLSPVTKVCTRCFPLTSSYFSAIFFSGIQQKSSGLVTRLNFAPAELTLQWCLRLCLAEGRKG